MSTARTFRAVLLTTITLVGVLCLASAAHAAPDPARVGLVTDIGGLRDRSFNALANSGLQGSTDLGAVPTVLESKSWDDYETNLDALATTNALVFGMGFLMGDAVAASAGRNPETKYAVIDFTYATAGGGWDAPTNVTGVIFNERQAGYVAGALAGKVEQRGGPRTNRPKVLSMIGGQRIPPVTRYMTGFRDGVKRTCRQCTVLTGYSQDFVDQSRCRTIAESHVRRGADIIFQVAGQCGLGALAVAKRHRIWGVGVDADQAYLGPHILTSAVKRVDVAVRELVRRHLSGTLVTGQTTSFSIAQDAVGVGRIAPAARKYQSVVDAAIRDLKRGTVR